MNAKDTLRFLRETAERLRRVSEKIGAPDLVTIAHELEREASNLESQIEDPTPETS